MSNTIDDLNAAFAGESQAFQKYTAYAKKSSRRRLHQYCQAL